jgi:SRSO17 transposase
METPVKDGPCGVADEAFLDRLEAYTQLFHGAFRRRDQARWLGVYLHGLLRAKRKKTIGALARQVRLPADQAVGDLAQALQNFLNDSPWDEAALWRRLRSLLADPADGRVFLRDVGFPKQGCHSVGVQRQFCDELGRKANCQVAITAWQVGGGRAVPLAWRLYLPRQWAGDLARLAAAGVPEAYRRPQPRAAVALELLDALRAEGLAVTQVAADGKLAAAPELRDGLAARGLPAPAASPAAAALTAQALGRLRGELGLDHFEGRSWRGFHHHVCLVALAFGFRLLGDGHLPQARNRGHPDAACPEGDVP